MIAQNKTQNWHAASYYRLLKTAGWVDNRIKAALKPYGITHAQLNVLSILSKHHPKPLDAKSIKEKLVVPSPDLTRLLDRLVKKGLVNRETCAENRRKIDITVTAEGIRVYRKIHVKAKQAVNHFFADNITVGEAKELFRILGKIG